jgi:hypothetical protein
MFILRSLPGLALPALSALVVLALLALPGFTQPTGQPSGQPSGSYAYPIEVTSVEVQVRRSAPPQVALDVEGVVGDGCTRLEQVVQWREGNTIVVRILGRHSGAEICTMIAQLYYDTIPVDGPLPPGDYAVDVNGVIRSLHIAGGSSDSVAAPAATESAASEG